MAVNAKDVKVLREKTGAGIMDCKKALIETGGDFEKAIKYLREKGLAEATKRSGREAKEGVITTVYSKDKGAVLMVEVNCETDFVSRTDKYENFVQGIANTLLKNSVESVDDLPEDVKGKVKEAISTFGENIFIRKIAHFKKSDETRSVFHSYIHLGGRAGVIVEFLVEDKETKANIDFQDFFKNIALQIASMSPISISRDSFPKDLLEEQKEIFMKQAEETGKPDPILEKIVIGRIGKLFSESCLLEQKYVKDSNVSVGKYLSTIEEKVGGKVEIKRFARFKLGEE